MYKIVILFYFFHSAFISGAQEQLPIPHESIAIDGFYSSSEWSDAKVWKKSTFSVYCKTDSLWLYIGVFSTKDATHYTDLYFRYEGGLVNMHASMKLGERQLPLDGNWDDNRPKWKWDNNENWTANTVALLPDAKESDSFIRQIKHYQGQEFKISKSKLQRRVLMLILVRDFIDESVYVTFPPDANTKDFSTWQSIIFD